MAKIIFALIQTRDVNLAGIATCLVGGASTKSHYRTLQRLVVNLNICYMSLAKLLLDIMGVTWDTKWLIAIDRTNWKFGSKNINIFMLSVCWQTVAIPLIWTMLDKAGTSNTDERKELISLFIKWFGVDRIEGLVGDREFIGDEWMQYLDDMGIPFYFRIKECMQIANSRGNFRTCNQLLRDLKPGSSLILKHPRRLGFARKGPIVYISALKGQDGELVIIATNGDVSVAAAYYKRRWEIEALFGCLKTRGFNLENTHLVHLERIQKLVALVSIAFVVAYKVGLWRHCIKPITLKNHGYKSISFFKYGLDYIRSVLFKEGVTTSEKVKEALEFLSKPITRITDSDT